VTIDFDPVSFSGVIPIFPLPEIVLFPNMLLPLHIFEPRYRAMVEDALEGEQLIGMAMLKEGWESDYYGTPPIRERIGMGKIVSHEKIGDGRYNILLVGIYRVEIEELYSPDPYRRAKVRLLEEETGDATGDELQRLRDTLVDGYDQLSQLVGSVKAAEEIVRTDVPLSVLVDTLTSVMELASEQKQWLLEEEKVYERAVQLSRLMADQIRSMVSIKNRNDFSPGDPRLN